MCAGCPFALQRLLRQQRTALKKDLLMCVPLTSLPPSTLSFSDRMMPAGWVCLQWRVFSDCTGAAQGDKSACMSLSSGYIFSPPLQQKILDQEQASVTRIFLRKFAWTSFHVSPWERFTNPASILAQFLIIWPSKLDVLHGLCYCGFIYSSGPSLIPKKAVL